MIPTWVLLVILWAPLLAGGAFVMRWAARECCDYEQLRRADASRQALRRAVEGRR